MPYIFFLQFSQTPHPLPLPERGLPPALVIYTIPPQSGHSEVHELFFQSVKSSPIYNSPLARPTIAELIHESYKGEK